MVRCPVCGEWVSEWERGTHGCFIRWLRQVDRKVRRLEEAFWGRHDERWRFKRRVVLT